MTQTATKTPSYSINQTDVYQQVTDTIIQQLEQGVVPWQKPFGGVDGGTFTIPKNFATGNRYKGINIVLLWAHAIKSGYQSDEWATFKQWNDKGERIRKGESAKTQMIVFYETYEKEVDGEIQKIPFAKVSNVYNRCQLQSYILSEAAKATTERTNLVETIDMVEAFVANTKAVVEHQGYQAFYSPMADRINMPFPECFENTEACTATEGYYSTLLHELSHWSGHKDRLNRLEKAKFGDKKYANEELVAEFSAAFMCAGFGIGTLEKGNHASYIDNWLTVLREDNRAIFRAASEANKVVEFLSSLQPT
jgi:antirestriction protein ArdC